MQRRRSPEALRVGKSGDGIDQACSCDEKGNGRPGDIDSAIMSNENASRRSFPSQICAERQHYC